MGKKFILFTGILEQQSALTLSGSEISHEFIDSFFARDGRNRLTIPGSSIAGSIIAFAHKMGFDLKDRALTCKFDKPEDNHQFMSLVRFFNLHPERNGQVTTEVRQMNGLLHRTRATAEEKRVLFNVECTPRGTKWPFLIEVDISQEKGRKAAGVVAAVLNFWKNKFGFLGGLTSRGMGWINATDDLKAIEVSGVVWPDSSFENPVKEAVNMSGEEKEIAELVKSASKVHTDWQYKEIKGTIKIGPRKIGPGDDDYGLDSLIIGGSEFTRWEFEENDTALENRFLLPNGQNKGAFINDPEHGIKSSDDIFIVSHYNNGLHPIIPGSSLKGAFRHELSRWRRPLIEVEGKCITDPNLTESLFTDKEDHVTLNFFGAVDEKKKEAEDSAFMVRDCYIKKMDYCLAKFEHHAEDEFTQGAYGSSKFDEVAMVQGEFDVCMVIIEKDETLRKGYDALIAHIADKGKNSMIDLGGKAFRGHGWPKMELKSDEWKSLGEV